jgi:hypothetical protein
MVAFFRRLPLLANCGRHYRLDLFERGYRLPIASRCRGRQRNGLSVSRGKRGPFAMGSRLRRVQHRNRSPLSYDSVVQFIWRHR